MIRLFLRIRMPANANADMSQPWMADMAMGRKLLTETSLFPNIPKLFSLVQVLGLEVDGTIKNMNNFNLPSNFMER